MKSVLRFLSIIALGVIFSQCQNNADVPYYNDPAFTAVFNPGPEQLAEFHRIYPFEFMNQDSQIVSLKTFKEKVYVSNFFFTVCPSICPKLTASMSRVQDAYKTTDDLLLISHTVTPWIDSIPKLKDYAENKDIISGKWHLVTGEKEDIYELARKAYFAEKEIGMQVDKDEFLHTENLILVDRNQHIRGIYNGTEPEQIDYLIQDIKKLLKE